MKQENFHIIAQIGQGGYGSVHLAQMKDTKEIVALKKMSKKLLHKLDEVSLYICVYIYIYIDIDTPCAYRT